jgi:hypothetical protein
VFDPGLVTAEGDDVNAMAASAEMARQVPTIGLKDLLKAVCSGASTFFWDSISDIVD